MQKGLELLLEKYSVKTKAAICSSGKSVEIDGQKIPLFAWESERRFIEMRNLVRDRAGQMSTYRIQHIASKGTDLNELLLREVGIAEFTTNGKTTEIFTIKNGDVSNSVIVLDNRCVCTIELAATLPKDTKAMDKHEIITDCGVVCDRVVDTQVPQESIYVFGKTNEVYTDTDAELFGHNADDAALIRNAFALSKDAALRETQIKKAAHLNKVIAASTLSAESMANIKVEG